MHTFLTGILVASLASPTETGAAPLDLLPAAATRAHAPPAHYLAAVEALDPGSLPRECRWRRRGPYMLLAAAGVQTVGALGFAVARYDLQHNGNAEGYAFGAGLSLIALVGGTVFGVVAAGLLAKDASAWRSCRDAG